MKKGGKDKKKMLRPASFTVDCCGIVHLCVKGNDVPVADNKKRGRQKKAITWTRESINIFYSINAARFFIVVLKTIAMFISNVDI